MTVRQWLNRGYELRAEIKSKKAIKCERISNAEYSGINNNFSGISTKNSSENKIDSVLEIDEEISILEQKWKAADNEIKEAIRTIPDVKIREVMDRRYRAYMKKSDIAESMDYSVSRISQLLNSGEKIIKNYQELSEIIQNYT